MEESGRHGLESYPSHTAERQRILAARGWEEDRDRTEVLRELLAAQLERIYLWSYARLRNRHQAVDYTRSVLVWISRSLGAIPEGCSLDAWVFEQLAVEGKHALPLKRSELGQEPRLVLSEFPNERYLIDYPMTKVLLDAFREYEALPTDLQLVGRSGWSIAAKDLNQFLEAHFGEESAETLQTRDPLSVRLSWRRWSFRTWVTVLATVGATATILTLAIQNHELRSELASRADGSGPGGTDGTPPTEESSNHVARIQGGAMIPNDRLILFAWSPVVEATSYDVLLFTAKMDTLYQRSGILAPRWTVRREEIPGFDPANSCLFKVDAFRGSDLIGTTGFVPYPSLSES